jgi:hypothetical protein
MKRVLIGLSSLQKRRGLSHVRGKATKSGIKGHRKWRRFLRLTDYRGIIHVSYYYCRLIRVKEKELLYTHTIIRKYSFDTNATFSEINKRPRMVVKSLSVIRNHSQGLKGKWKW